jgi:hypothetical protein
VIDFNVISTLIQRYFCVIDFNVISTLIQRYFCVIDFNVIPTLLKPVFNAISMLLCSTSSKTLKPMRRQKILDNIAALKLEVREESNSIDEDAAHMISKLPTVSLRKLAIQVYLVISTFFHTTTQNTQCTIPFSTYLFSGSDVFTCKRT